MIKRIPVAALEHVRPSATFGERVRLLVAAYRSGKPVPPIPICVGPTGKIRLFGDGNHRIRAVRLSGVSHVKISCNPEQAEALNRIAAKYGG